MSDETTALTRSTDDAAAIERTHQWLVDRKKRIAAELSVHAADIGEFLIDTFFDGDIEQACSHNPHKQTSLRKLCSRADAPFSLTALRTFLRVAHNFRFLMRDDARKLPPSHHVLLYRVADTEERAQLAARCVQEGTSTRRLKQLVKGRGRRKPGAGRKPFPPTVKDLREVGDTLDEIAGKVVRDELHPGEELEALINEVRALRDKLTRVADQLEDRRGRR